MELEGLEFQVKSSAEQASKSIDTLIKSLNRLKKLTVGDVPALSKTTDGLKKLNKVLSEFDTKKLNRITNALNGLNSVRDVTISSTLPKRLGDLGTSIKRITYKDIDSLKDLTETLRDLGTVGNVSIPNIKQRGRKSSANGITDVVMSETFTKTMAIVPVFTKSMKDVVDHLLELEFISVRVKEAFSDMTNGCRRFEGQLTYTGTPIGKLINEVKDLNDNVIRSIVPFKEVTLAVRNFSSQLATFSNSKGISQVFTPFQQLVTIFSEVRDSFEEIIEGTWRYVTVAGELSSGVNQAIVPFRELGIVLTETKEKMNDVIEGTYRYITTTSSSASGVGQFGDRVRNVFSQITDSIRQFGENVQHVFQNVVTVTGEVIEEFTQWVGQIGTAITGAISAIMPFITVLQVVLRAISAVVNAIKKFINTVWNLLSPVRELAKELGKKMFDFALRGFAKMGDIILSPFTKIKKTINDIKNGLKNLISSIGRVAVYRAIRTIMKEISQGFREGINNLYQWSKLINGEFSQSMDKLNTSMLYLKNSLGAMVSPIINAIAPAMDMLVDKFVEVINVVNMLISRLSNKETYTAAKKLVKAYQEIKNATIGIDELNIIGDTNDYADMFEELPITDDVKDFADKLKEAFKNGDWEDLGIILGEKFNELVEKVPWEEIGEKVGGFLNGVLVTAFYFLDTVDFVRLGSHIADFVNNVINSVDWEIAGRMVIKKMTIIWDFVIGFLKELDWAGVAIALTKFVVGVFSEFTDWLKSWDWRELGEIFTKKIHDFFSNLDIAEIGRQAGEFLKTLFSSFREWIENVDWVQIGEDLFNAIIDFIQNFDFQGVVREFFSLLGAAAKAIKDLLKPFWDGIVNWWNENIKAESFTQTLKNLADYLIKFVDENVLTPFMQAFMGEGLGDGQSGLDKLKEIGSNIVHGIIQGAENYTKEHLWKWIADFFFGSWWDQLCLVFGIHSPAESMYPIGENIMLGILEGMVGKLSAVIDFASQLIETLLQSLTDFSVLILEKVGSLFGTVLDSSGQFFVDVLSSVGTGIADIALAVGSGVAGIVTSVTGAVSGIVTSVGNAVGNIINSIGQATSLTILSNAFDRISKATDSTNGTIEKLIDAMGAAAASAHELASAIHSVSKAMSLLSESTSIASMALGGFGQDGIRYFKDVTQLCSDMSRTMDDAARGITSFTDALSDTEAILEVDIEYNDPGFEPAPVTLVVDVVYADSGFGGAHALGGIVPHATGGIVPHAKGSIISKPTMQQYKGQTHLFGEAGREAILPLDSYTGWMDEIATKVIKKMDQEGDSKEGLTRIADSVQGLDKTIIPAFTNVENLIDNEISEINTDFGNLTAQLVAFETNISALLFALGTNINIGIVEVGNLLSSLITTISGTGEKLNTSILAVSYTVDNTLTKMEKNITSHIERLTKVIKDLMEKGLNLNAFFSSGGSSVPWSELKKRLDTIIDALVDPAKAAENAIKDAASTTKAIADQNKEVSNETKNVTKTVADANKNATQKVNEVTKNATQKVNEVTTAAVSEKALNMILKNQNGTDWFTKLITPAIQDILKNAAKNAQDGAISMTGVRTVGNGTEYSLYADFANGIMTSLRNEYGKNLLDKPLYLDKNGTWQIYYGAGGTDMLNNDQLVKNNPRIHDSSDLLKTIYPRDSMYVDSDLPGWYYTETALKLIKDAVENKLTKKVSMYDDYGLNQTVEIVNGIITSIQQQGTEYFGQMVELLDKPLDPIKKGWTNANWGINSESYRELLTRKLSEQLKKGTDMTIIKELMDTYITKYWKTHALGGIVAHASGGIFSEPTFMNLNGSTHLFGEAGREAILPLDSYTDWMDDVADRVEERFADDGEGTSFEQALNNFYYECLAPVMAEISTDTKRNANKDTRPIVKIDGRDVRDAYDRQTKIDGYKFVR